MNEPKRRHVPATVSNAGRPARKSTEIQPAGAPDDVVLETYEQSPERPGGDERSRPSTPDGPMPDGPMPDRERATPD